MRYIKHAPGGEGLLPPAEGRGCVRARGVAESTAGEGRQRVERGGSGPTPGCGAQVALDGGHRHGARAAPRL